MFENAAIAAKGIEVLCTMCHVDEDELTRMLVIGQDTPAVIELTYKDTIYRGYDFRVDPSKRDEIMAIIDHRDEFRSKYPSEQFCNQGVKLSGDGKTVEAAFYFSRKVADKTPDSQ